MMSKRELSPALGEAEDWLFERADGGSVRVVSRTFFAARARAMRILGTDEIALVKGPFDV